MRIMLGFRQLLILFTLLLSIVSLFLEQAEITSLVVLAGINVLDYLIVGMVLLDLGIEFYRSKYKKLFFRENRYSLIFLLVFLFLFGYNKLLTGGGFVQQATKDLASTTVILRSLFLILKVYGRLQKFSRYLEGFTTHPAQTILLSFLLVILTGALILMMGFTTRDGKGLPFLDALFTSTSAVCVTGLIVVDTATQFTRWGQAVILLLIQIGGLGIMILSSFALFTIRRRVSLMDKLLLSYMLSEEDMSNLYKALSSIVVATLTVELGGALLLFLGFYPAKGLSWETWFFSIFHAVSAFCNAGFALFSDSLEGFRSDPLVIGTISILIILGGIGFSVISNLAIEISRLVKKVFHPRFVTSRASLTLNSRIVLKYTAYLLLSGTFFVYLLEHGHTMKNYSLGEQYLSAFFQSVTLRTAGFNSIPFGSLMDAMYLIMILYMFIGAASGSTAGGIKVNTLAVIVASLEGFLKNRKGAVIRNYSISQEQISRAYLILIFGFCAVVTGTFLLSLTEQAPFLHILFEAVSAFGTVGLSAGITPHLTPYGKLVIIALMYVGRLGPLTILSSLQSSSESVKISYPTADLSIG